MNYVKVSGYLILAILPLSLIGYYFSGHHESVFFLYEWLFFTLLLGALTFSIIGVFKNREQRWSLYSMVAFIVQFSVLSLFLGPLTFYQMFYFYYITATIGAFVYIWSIRKTKNYRFLPIVFFIISAMLTLYIVILNNLWGKDLS
ncbi:hypothetical protein [Peribacillus tepidiphilus]|uniref:hypothetical protein n=1 Tax=Peribacillus tepidiphilus TaxID=2652445 RepID=UPI0035B547B4